MAVIFVLIFMKGDNMRLPNSFGSVYKLSGKRRKPWAARKTVGWKTIEDTMQCHPVYQFIGYYATRAEALSALTAYNENPYDLKADTITFKEVYDKWSGKHYEAIKNSNGYKAAYSICSSLDNMIFKDIKLNHLQAVVDHSGKNTPTLRNLRNLWSLMWEYAVIHEIIPPDKRDIIKYVDISNAGNPNAYNRKPFSKKAIKSLWNASGSNEYISAALILIYTGLRISELLDLKKEDVHLDERWFYVKESKTSAGIREVPIAEKIVPFFEFWLSKKSDYLICTPEGRHFLYRNFYDSYWRPIMDALSLKYTPHCTRHTCISLLTEAGVDERIIQQIVGHKRQNVTQVVYTHIDLPNKLEAINKI